MTIHANNRAWLVVAFTGAAVCWWVACGPARADGLIGSASDAGSLVGTLIQVTDDDLAVIDDLAAVSNRAAIDGALMNAHGSAAESIAQGHVQEAVTAASRPGAMRPASLRPGQRSSSAGMSGDVFPLSRAAVPLLVGGPPASSGASGGESSAAIRPLVGPVVGVRPGYLVSGIGAGAGR